MMPSGTYDLGYLPNNAAFGQSTFNPGEVADGLWGEGDMGWMLRAMFNRAMTPEKKNWEKYNAEQAEYRARARAASQAGRDQRSSLQKAAENEALRAQIAQSRAMYGTDITGGQPLRQLTGFNMHGMTPDTQKFTGAQRQMFLPQNATGVGDLNIAGDEKWRDAPLVRPAEITERFNSGQPIHAFDSATDAAGQGNTAVQQGNALMPGNPFAAQMYPGFARYAAMTPEQREADRQDREKRQASWRRPDEHAWAPA
jgi:hypothetical protein